MSPLQRQTLSLLTSRPISNPAGYLPLLRLPSACRAFHATPQPRYMETVLSTTHTVLEGIHSTTGLPWCATLPLAALCIRLGITFPLGVYTRILHQRQLDLQPLLYAWNHQIRKEVEADKRYLSATRKNHGVQMRTAAKRRSLYSRWGCQYWKMWLPMVQLPIWLLVIETVRKMVGAGQGIIGMMLLGSNKPNADEVAVVQGKDSISVGLESEPVQIDLAQGDEELQWALNVMSKMPQGTTDLPTEITTTSTTAPSSLLDPTLATEGMLWFSDLTVPDPQLILPFMLSGVMFLNLMPSRRNALASGEVTVWRRRLTRGLQVIALCAGPLTLQLPSGMLLYWVSSGALGFGQAVLLDFLMPLRMPVKPCSTIEAKGGLNARLAAVRGKGKGEALGRPK